MNFYLRFIPILSFTLFTALNPATAQRRLSFTNLTVENGLSQNSVMAVAQDSTGLIWLGTRQGVNRYDGYRFKIYKSEEKNNPDLPPGETTALLTDAQGTLWAGTSKGFAVYNGNKDIFEPVKGLSNSNVESLYQDRQKRLWIGTLGGINLLIDKKQRRFEAFFFSKKAKDPVNSIYAMFQDENGQFWIGTGKGLFTMRYSHHQVSYQKVALPNSTDGDYYITAIASDKQHHIWVGSSNGLYQIAPDGKNIRSFLHSDNNPNSIIHNDIREVMLDKDGMVWVGTQNGLSILNPANGYCTNYQHDPEKPYSISQNSIHNLFTDRDGNIWVGTYFGGVNISYPTLTNFKVYRNSKQQNSLSNNVVSSIVEIGPGFWIGTEGGGLNYFNPANNTFKSYKNNPADQNSISSNLVKIIEKESDASNRLFIGTHRGGLNLFDPASNKFRHIANVKDTIGTVGTAEIIALEMDSHGTLWVGSFEGLTVLEKKNGEYPAQTSKSPLESRLKSKNITCLFQDSWQQLWIGTNAGLNRYDLNLKKIYSYTKEENNKLKLPSNYINCITQSSNGKVLVGTRAGLSIFDPTKGTFTTYSETNGLVNNNVVGIIEDNAHNLWISTSNGISELNIASGRFRNYNKSDGLAGNEFNVRSFFKDRQGQLFFGGFNGLTAFYPQEIELNNFVSPLVFTDLKLFNQYLKVGGDDDILQQQINLTDKLDFRHDQNQFTLEFSLLNYLKSDKNKYFYKLDGYDKDWIATVNPSASYTNLPAGNYRFMLKALNNDGIPGKPIRSLHIHVSPAPWASWWAYLLYLVVFFTILLVTIRYFFVKALLKRTEDIQQMKLQFFTQVSHEIRTPLTLILAPLETLFKNTRNLPDINKQVERIKSNADRLHLLVTELLDFRKTETGHLKLKFAQQDLVPFVQQIFQAFEHLAESRNITYTFSYEQPEVSIWFDKLQLEKVFFNLLSNAFKFTNDGGTINVTIADNNQQVAISVRDNGLGIPEDSRDKIFSDFFQVDREGSTHIGSGIGLALSKSIVTAHGGQLLLESIAETETKPGDTRFTVLLKKEQPQTAATMPQESGTESWHTLAPLPLPAVTEASSTKENHSETVLIVEDNWEIRQMLRDSLESRYHIVECENGQEGLETAIASIPDLIICDVMMPIMNGTEMCHQLKIDERTSHIPVIILTAMDSHAQQVDGLATGADSYITKPFSVELLGLHVRNLLQSRKIMRRKFSGTISESIQLNTVDQQFIEKVIQRIEARLADQTFGVPELAKDIGMTAPVLYKKIRAVTDLTVNDFIKSIRLKKAEALLKEGIHNVAEVAYLVGFNDAKYFSREFKKQYGINAKNYQLGGDKNATD
ncbi:two-component regulator propeller domain-containing protein [Pedobacter sp. ASV12]|uniref:two-component regulator propeller domain-containing protein n=1 Tax=Pedobacter sp. ASV12 TaxID=2795120 RepID=UPI0018EAAC1E|nr:two-component regulator propeller domain-containing protein [Pedobacter sp. ASV12]